MKKQGLHYKLIKAFLLQILLISLATLLGVFSAEKIVEKVLVRQALVGEATQRLVADAHGHRVAHGAFVFRARSSLRARGCGHHALPFGTYHS